MARILLIDDIAEVRTVLRDILEDDGHEVIEANNGEKALRLIASYAPDLVITDILMPDKEGIETIIEMRRSRDKLKIIAVSGGGATKNMSFLKIASELGADKCLSKPVRPDVLIETVNELLARPRQSGTGKAARG